MVEQTSPTRYIPLRVRFRASNETIATLGDSLRRTEPLVLDLSNASETERHAQKIRELAKLGYLLHAGLSMDEVLQRIASSAAACTGFHVLVLHLLDQETRQLTPVAFDGVPDEDQRILSAMPVSWEALQRLMQPEFRLGQSYFISHEYTDLYAEKLLMLNRSTNECEAGTWHSDDLLFVPLYGPRAHKLLGTISLDDPVDGKVPTVESVEVIQLFVNMAATAIDNVLLCQQREEEQVALAKAVALFDEDIEALQKGSLHHRIRAQHPLLEPVAHVLNTMTGAASSALDNVDVVADAVDEHMHNVQGHTEKMLRNASQQEVQVKHISQVLSEMAHTMHHITESAALLSRTVAEVAEVFLDAQNTVERTVKGMMALRESLARASRIMQGLIESSQEINSVVPAPTELTTRLHVLALNAAIEATRAGEQGRGFALVAQELRSLAASSKESARKIEGYIQSTQHETLAVWQSIEEGTQQVMVQTEAVIQASVALDTINSIAEQLPGLIQDICVVAENQSQGSQMAVNALNEIFRTKTDITDHIQEMQQSMRHLVELTAALRSRMIMLAAREH